MPKTTENIRSFARAHTKVAIKTLAGIMTNEDTPAAARVAAVNSLLDRGWGKPKQDHNIDAEVLLEIVTNVDRKLEA